MTHEIIYLAPPCFGEERYWCEDEAPVDCECADGPHSWTRYERTTPKSSEGALLDQVGAALSDKAATIYQRNRMALALLAKAGKAQS